MNFLTELRRRNPLLYWFGWYNLIAGIVCLALSFIDDMQLLGISRWVKPMKFFLSVGIVMWTLGWLMFYLKNQKAVRISSWIITISMFFENFIIAMQSARGTVSHFNTRSAFDGMLFSVMGILIGIFTLVVIYITILFCVQNTFSISSSYLWGIRLGLILFLIFSSEGGMMVARFSHTVGGIDGGPGLPLVNWSTQYGDLRIAHFLGMHALQVLPLAGFYIFKTRTGIILFSLIYAAVVVMLFMIAMRGIPLIG